MMKRKKKKKTASSVVQAMVSLIGYPVLLLMMSKKRKKKGGIISCFNKTKRGAVVSGSHHSHQPLGTIKNTHLSTSKNLDMPKVSCAVQYSDPTYFLWKVHLRFEKEVELPLQSSWTMSIPPPIRASWLLPSLQLLQTPVTCTSVGSSIPYLPVD